MKKRFTKALALLLSAMLIIGLAPTAFAADSESTTEMSEVKVVYDFTKTGLSSERTYLVAYETDGTRNPTTYDDTYGFWAYHSQKGGNDKWSSFNDSFLKFGSYGTPDGYVVLEIDVPVAGKYDVSFEYYKSVTQGITDGKMYILPGDITDISSELYYTENEEKKLKEGFFDNIDYTATSTLTAKEYNFGTAGKYYLVFLDCDAMGTAMFPKKLILDGGTGVVPIISSLISTPNGNGGATVQAEATLMSDRTTASDVTYSYSVASDDTEIASVDATTGVVTGKLNGTATIIATATVGSYSSSKSIEVSVTNPDMSGIKAVYSMEVPSVSNGSVMNNVNFTDTNNFWAFEEQYGTVSVQRHTDHGVFVYPNEGSWYALRFYVPRTGKYSLKLDYSMRSDGGLVFFYFGKDSEGATKIVKNEKIGSLKFNASSAQSGILSGNIATVEIDEPGDYILVVRVPLSADFAAEGMDASKRRHFFKKIILDGGSSTVPMINVTADNDAITVGGTAKVTATSALMSDATTAVTNPEITYATEDTDIVSVNSSTGEVTGLSDGVATVTATVTANGKSSSRSIDITVNNKEISEGFNAKMEVAENYIAPSVTGLTEGGVITAQPNADGSYNLTAPDAKDGSEFLYWAMGMGTNKRIVSFDAILEKYVPEGNNVNYLVPVYASDVAADVEEYYNINGQRIAAIQIGAEKPALPSIPGIGAAKEWKKCAENVYVAEYESTVYNKVTVNGEKVDYGTKIECKPDAKEGTFRFWKKTVNGKEEVVSLEPEYTFYAWENTTVTAEYGDDAPMFTGEKLKIIIDSFDVNGETGIMAEFIGLSNAVEKGIMFTDTASSETRKMAMTTKDNQFTVIANMSGTYTGYAIVGDKANGYTLITDGEYIK